MYHSALMVRLRAVWRDASMRYPTLSKVALSLAIVSVAWSGWFAYDVCAGLPGGNDIRSIANMAQATILYDVADRPVFTLFKEQRIEVPLSRIAPHLVRAIVAVEDRRFFDHRGVDSIRLLSAAWNNVLEWRAAQGGSTITQQLARQSFLTSEKTVRRKLKEAVLAARIEGTYSKERILELYLNKVYFGEGLYGAEAAARGYLGKSAAELDVAEAALLAGLVKSPSTYAPTVSLERATARRNIVLQAMLDQRVISRDVCVRAMRSRVKVQSPRAQEANGLHFKEQVRRELVGLFGVQRVYEGGLHVYTTIDPAMQKAAEASATQSLSEIEARQASVSRRSGQAGTTEADPLQAALLALDPRTGEVRAMVGGRDFAATGFNRATQAKRQAGSAFKPFVYAAALEAGYSPASLIQHLDDPIMTLQGAWSPEDEHSNASAMTIRTALRTSSNRAAVRMLEEVGIARAASYAQRLGLGAVPQVPSLALGSGEVTLLSMTTAYAAFAAQGIVRRPLLVRRVVDAHGAVLFQSTPSEQRAVSETTAFLMAHILADVVNYGTAYRARRVGFTLPAAGKTGTTNEFKDAWFVGFTPSLVAGVWVGFDQPRTIVRNGFAGELAVPLWARFMKAATSNDRPSWFTPPRDIVTVNVCRLSGKLPSDGCDDVAVVNEQGELVQRSLVYTEYFARGTEPQESCDLHPGRSFFQALAGVFHGSREQTVVTTTEIGAPGAGHAPASVTADASPEAPAADAPPQAPPKKKRGFFSRIFGIGKD